MELPVLIAMFVGHFMGDFVFQSETIAKNKSKDPLVLFVHVLIYTISVGMATIFVLDGHPIDFLFFLVATGFLHFCTDSVTSRITGHYHKLGKEHAFFTTIGADQMIHMICLVTVWKFIV